MKILLGLGLFFTSTFAADFEPQPIEGITMNCFQEALPVEYSFCINKFIGSKSQDLIYHFHGRDGNATWWNDQNYYTGQVHAQWLKNGFEIPTVVTVSFGKVWLLTERPDQSNGGLSAVFISDVLPRIEKEISVKIARRLLVGESMGGINALMTAFKSGVHFAKIASLCAPLPTVSPFASPAELWAYFKRAGTTKARALSMIAMAKMFYPNEETWRNNDPVQVSKNYNSTHTPPLYLNCGKKDEYGCMEGSEIIIKNIHQNKGSIVWNPRDGGHCDIEPKSLAKFLIR